MDAQRPSIEHNTLICEKLREIERERGVRVLHACESGSRMWGFPSTDSDYDVRFVYVHPCDWYLSFNVERRRDVIEVPHHTATVQADGMVDGPMLDFAGWDLRKALGLLVKTNCGLLEWMQSPIVYRTSHISRLGEGAASMERLSESERFFEDAVLGFFRRVFNPIAACYHYSHLARGPKHTRISTKKPIRPKQLLYALRGLLCVRYVEEMGDPPPVKFIELLEWLLYSSARWEGHPDFEGDVRLILVMKERGVERGEWIQTPDSIRSFAQYEFERHGDSFKGLGRPVEDRQAVIDDLNVFFRQCVASAWG